MDLHAFTGNPERDFLTGLFQLQLLEKLLVVLKLTLCIDVVLGVETFLDCFLLLKGGQFLGTCRRFTPMNDPLGPHDGGEHLSAFLELVLLIADGLVEFRELLFGVALFDLSAIGLIVPGDLACDVFREVRILFAGADFNEVGAAEVSGFDVVLEALERGLLVHAPAGVEGEIFDDLFEVVAAFDFLELGAEELRAHAVCSRGLGHHFTQGCHSAGAWFHLDGGGGFVVTWQQ